MNDLEDIFSNLERQVRDKFPYAQCVDRGVVGPFHFHEIANCVDFTVSDSTFHAWVIYQVDPHEQHYVVRCHMIQGS